MVNLLPSTTQLNMKQQNFQKFWSNKTTTRVQYLPKRKKRGDVPTFTYRIPSSIKITVRLIAGIHSTVKAVITQYICQAWCDYNILGNRSQLQTMPLSLVKKTVLNAMQYIRKKEHVFCTHIKGNKSKFGQVNDR